MYFLKVQNIFDHENFEEDHMVSLSFLLFFFSAFMTNAAQKLNDYWNEKRGGNEKTAPQNQYVLYNYLPQNQYVLYNYFYQSH